MVFNCNIFLLEIFITPTTLQHHCRLSRRNLTFYTEANEPEYQNQNIGKYLLNE